MNTGKVIDTLNGGLASLRELQSETQEELDALLLSVRDGSFGGRQQ